MSNDSNNKRSAESYGISDDLQQKKVKTSHIIDHGVPIGYTGDAKNSMWGVQYDNTSIMQRQSCPLYKLQLLDVRPYQCNT